MASRAEHFRAKAKHAQRDAGYVKPAPLDNDSWITAGMEACRKLAGEMDNILLYSYALEMDITAEESDRRLRHLSKLGFLKMTAERDEEGNFIRYVWSMVDPNLPRASDLA